MKMFGDDLVLNIINDKDSIKYIFGYNSGFMTFIYNNHISSMICYDKDLLSYACNKDNKGLIIKKID